MIIDVLSRGKIYNRNQVELNYKAARFNMTNKICYLIYGSLTSVRRGQWEESKMIRICHTFFIRIWKPPSTYHWMMCRTIEYEETCNLKNG